MFSWNLPDPTMVPIRVVAPAPYMTAAVRIPGIAALHLGVLSGQMIIFEIVPKPKDVTFTRQEAYPCPSLLRARGPKQAANGSSLLIALPSTLVANGNTLVKAYARLPRRLALHDDFYAPLMQYYDPLLRVLHVELSPLAFDDDRPSASGNEALIVLAVARPR